MTTISPRMPYEKKSVEVNGYAMAYTDEGEGDPVVFLHGNATSSYMWRNIMPYLEGKGRLIAIDNIGQGDSAKLAHSGPEVYTLAEHQTFIDGTLAALGVTDNVTFVMHDWGGPLGLTWARRHEQSIKGLAFCETLVCDHASYEDYPAAVGGLLTHLMAPNPFSPAGAVHRAMWRSSGKPHNAPEGRIWSTEGRYFAPAGRCHAPLVVIKTTAQSLPGQQTRKPSQMGQ